MYPASKRTHCRCWIYYLDLIVWTFTLPGFNSKLDHIIFIDSGPDTNHF